MNCKYIWTPTLVQKVKESLNIDLFYKWSRIPQELNVKLADLKQSKPECYLQHFTDNFKFVWSPTLPQKIELLCNLNECIEPN